MLPHQTADIIELTKRCTKCGVEKPYCGFGKSYGREKFGLKSHCNQCRNNYSKEWRGKNHQEWLAKRREKRSSTPPEVLAEQKKRWYDNSKARQKIDVVSRVCTKCKSEKPIDQFAVYSSSPTGRNPQCKSCTSAYQRALYASSESYRKCKISDTTKRNRKSKYGVTQEMFEAIFSAQDKKCAICLSDLDGSKFSLKAHMDHCHNTNKVRGILCGQCNTALGNFKDNEKIILSALDYLRKYRRENDR